MFGEFKKHIDSSLKAEDLLIALSLASSKREARTFISGNSVSINGNKISDPNELIGKEMALFGKYLIVKRGKKNYALAEF